MLRARGYQVLVVSPDPINHRQISFDREFDPDHKLGYRIAALERNLLIKQIVQAGIQVLNWQVETPLQNAINYAFS